MSTNVFDGSALTVVRRAPAGGASASAGGWRAPADRRWGLPGARRTAVRQYRATCHDEMTPPDFMRPSRLVRQLDPARRLGLERTVAVASASPSRGACRARTSTAMQLSLRIKRLADATERRRGRWTTHDASVDIRCLIAAAGEAPIVADIRGGAVSERLRRPDRVTVADESRGLWTPTHGMSTTLCPLRAPAYPERLSAFVRGIACKTIPRAAPALMAPSR